MNYWFGSNNLKEIHAAVDAGIKTVWIDLERLGKEERQPLNTRKSNHHVLDITKVRREFPKIDILVRVDPINENSKFQIDQVIEAGADKIMLPFFRSLQEVEKFTSYVAGRCSIGLLVETGASLVRLDRILNKIKVDFVHLGINDLSIDLKLDFMFEVFDGWVIDYFAGLCRKHNVKYGIGGVSFLYSGVIPSNLVISELKRLKCDNAIISRQFQELARKPKEFKLKFKELENYRRSIKQSEIIQNQSAIKELIKETTDG
jgi:hypothetical protein